MLCGQNLFHIQQAAILWPLIIHSFHLFIQQTVGRLKVIQKWVTKRAGESDFQRKRKDTEIVVSWLINSFQMYEGNLNHGCWLIIVCLLEIDTEKKIDLFLRRIIMNKYEGHFLDTGLSFR